MIPPSTRTRDITSPCSIYHSLFSLHNLLWPSILFLLLWPSVIQAATPYTPTYTDPVLEPWRWTTYTELNGLSTFCITEDSTGAMWFGTSKGVHRYDGITWTVYTPDDGLAGAPTSALLTARDGSVYAKSKSGISRFRDGQWKRVAPALKETSIFTVFMGMEETSDGSIWTAAGQGALRITEQKMYLYTTPEIAAALPSVAPEIEPLVFPGAAGETWHIWDIFEDQSGALWFGLNLGEVVRCTVDKTDLIKTHVYQTEYNADYANIPIFTQAQDGTLWVVTPHRFSGIHQFDGKMWTSFRLSEKLPDEPPSRASSIDINVSIHETKDGTVWIGSHSGILSAYRKGVWTGYNPPDVPVSHARIRDLYESSDGALWVVGLQEVCRLDYSHRRWATYEDLWFQGDIPDGTQWFANPAAKTAIRHHPTSNTWTQYDQQDGLITEPEWLLVTKKGDAWASGSHDNIAATAQFHALTNTWILRKHPQHSQLYNKSAYESSDGTLYFGGAGGVLQYNPSNREWTSLVYSSEWTTISGIAQTTNGELWVGGSGVRKYDGKVWTEIREPPELVEGYIDVIYRTDDDHLWVANRSHGLFQYDGETWTQHTIRNGLAHNQVRALAQAHDGSLYAYTTKGMSRYDGRTWTTRAFAAQSDAINYGGIFVDRQGALWMNQANLDGKFFTIRYTPNKQPPETNINVYSEEVAQTSKTTIAWNGSDSWQVTPENMLEYAWRLDNNKWSPYSQNTSHILEDLPDGDHTFAVKTRDLDYNEDPTPAIIHFTVIPPIYKQPWFIALMAVLLSAITFQTVRVIRRDRRLQLANAALSDANKELFEVNVNLEKANTEIQQQSERKSTFLASMSHELRTPLNAIKGFASLVARRSGDVLPQQQKDNLAKVDQASDHLLAMINDLLDLSKIEAGRMDVSPTTFNVEKLLASCVSTVSPLVQEGVQIEYEVVDGIGEAHTDEARVRQMLINLLSNAVKFTEKGEIKVTVTSHESGVTGQKSDAQDGSSGLETQDPRPKAGLLEIAVSDTGKGIPKEELSTIFDEYRQVKGSESSVQKGTGLGLSITRKFAELLGGTIEVASEVGRGSVFTVMIPVNYEG